MIWTDGNSKIQQWPPPDHAQSNRPRDTSQPDPHTISLQGTGLVDQDGVLLVCTCGWRCELAENVTPEAAVLIAGSHRREVNS